MNYVNESVRKKIVIIGLFLFSFSLFFLCYPEYISQHTFVDDNNLHADTVRESIQPEIPEVLRMFKQYSETPQQRRTEFLFSYLQSIGYDLYNYKDKYNTTGLSAVLRPRRTDDRSCILLMGRYSTNMSSPLNPSKMPEINTLMSMLIIAKKLTKCDWLARNFLLVFLEDTTSIGRNDFFNVYQKNPFCGRIIAGLELDVESSSYGATELSIVIPSQIYMPNQDIYNGYISHLNLVYYNLTISKMFSKYSHSIFRDGLLHASFIRYTDSTESGYNNVDMLCIQSTYNDTKQQKSVPHRILLTTYITLLRSFNNLYQQLQYSTHFYIPSGLTSYINFPMIILFTVTITAPIILFSLISIIPESICYIFKSYPDSLPKKLIVLSDILLSTKTEISHPTTIYLVIFYFILSTILYIPYLFLFGWNIVSIEDHYNYTQFNQDQSIYLICVNFIPVIISLLLSHYTPPLSLSQLRLNISFASLPSLFVCTVFLFINPYFALLYGFILGVTSLISFIVLLYKPSFFKFGRVICLITSLPGFVLLLLLFSIDISILVYVPTLVTIAIIFYIPVSMSHIYSMFSFNSLVIKQNCNKD
ncbi:hypothetical protein EDI_306220 [Entamoeba dispar SAW760]|uniref:Uncharacterized protein n=1 Tax=Entamoeba dispar (strain ATCC PRA-260 / SAW760) TaxID=370354 RepID=B0EMK7_ENTDS|nr:uncharacterized protein EDI_306220 [Entamoeba dispar SAW760]EDR24253.1 hypothetical protein EDI_306220 [Entamoeba dispar SAW760]|eukprot:EDR24253.1 hypothetical protein EDI_306220 [Entamoeba dispar SAW760]